MRQIQQVDDIKNGFIIQSFSLENFPGAFEKILFMPV